MLSHSFVTLNASGVKLLSHIIETISVFSRDFIENTSKLDFLFTHFKIPDNSDNFIFFIYIVASENIFKVNLNPGLLAAAPGTPGSPADIQALVPTGKGS